MLLVVVLLLLLLDADSVEPFHRACTRNAGSDDTDGTAVIRRKGLIVHGYGEHNARGGIEDSGKREGGAVVGVVLAGEDVRGHGDVDFGEVGVGWEGESGFVDEDVGEEGT